MKNKLLIILIAAITVLSCEKDKDDANFTWTFLGQNYTANFANAYSASMGAPLIIGGLGTSISSPGSGPRINVISFAPGVYTFGGIVPNSLNYVDPQGFDLPALGGSVTITSNNDNKLSGNFSATLGNVQTITGSFTNVRINP